MKLIELINGIATSEDTFAKIKEVSEESANPRKVRLPGLRSNRVVIPMITKLSRL